MVFLQAFILTISAVVRPLLLSFDEAGSKGLCGRISPSNLKKFIYLMPLERYHVRMYVIIVKFYL